jgi:hypothetical protein
VDHAQRGAARVLKPDAHAPGREAVEEVDRAVQGIDHPAPPVLRLAAGALLGEQPVIRPLRDQDLLDGALGLTIGLGDGIGLARLAVEPLYRSAEALEQNLTGGQGCPFGQLQVGLEAQKRARRIRTTATIRPTVTAT